MTAAIAERIRTDDPVLRILATSTSSPLIAATAIAWDWPGWGLLGLLFVVAGAGIAAVAFRAARQQKRGPCAEPGTPSHFGVAPRLMGP